MKIVVLAGGISTERVVSLTSSAVICNTLRKAGHQAVMIDTFLGMPDIKPPFDRLFEMDGSMLELPPIDHKEPDIEEIRRSRPGGSKSFWGPNVIEICREADICYLGLHGGAGENGQVQASLDMLGIRYTGAGYLSSGVAMHKGFTKAIFKAAGVPAPDGFLLLKKDADRPLSDFGFSLPLVVKTCSGGSSIGVYITHTEKEYRDALRELFRTESEIIVEDYIKGREFAVGVVAGHAYPVIEIIPREGWFDYEHKYQDGFSREVCPADISSEVSAKMMDAAERASRALSLEVYSRMDFMLDENENVYCLEANSLPGMTPASLLPKEAAAVGISFMELCERIIDESMKKYENTTGD